MAQPQVNTYDYGSRLSHILRVEVNDEPEDPGALSVYVLSPAGVQTGPFTPTKEAKGLYSWEQTYSSSPASAAFGTWSLYWKGAGTAEGGRLRQHYINSVPFAGV